MAGLAQSLPLLRSLETLDLTAIGCTVPALDFAPLRRLKKLALFGTAPESQQLPPGCEVRIRVATARSRASYLMITCNSNRQCSYWLLKGKPASKLSLLGIQHKGGLARVGPHFTVCTSVLYA